MDRLRNLLFACLLAVASPVIAAEPVNINTADQETLMSIDGIGEKRAMAIIEYRDRHGPFTSVEDLLQVNGVGEVTLESNREMLTVGQ